MLGNSPTVRAVVYGAAVVAQIAAFFVRAADPSGAWAGAVQDTANFLGGMAGLTALGNLAATPPAGAPTKPNGTPPIG